MWAWEDASAIYFFCHLNWKPTGRNFLKIGCNKKSETISMNSSYSVTLKSIGLACILKIVFTHSWFYNTIYWKILFHWAIHIFQILTHFTIQYLKITLINITTSIVIKVVKYWEAVKLMVADWNFPKPYNIHLKDQILSLATNI